MKVTDATTGHETDSSIEDYADRTANAIRKRLTEALTASAGRAFPTPEVLAGLLIPSFDDLAAHLALATPDTETNELATRLGPFWSQSKVAEALAGPGGVPKSRQTLNERRKSGALLGLRTADNKTIYPVRQFHRVNGVVEVKPGVKAVLSVLRDQDPWTVALFLRTPAPELARRTPLDLAGSEDSQVLEQLRTLARHVRHEWAA